MKYLLIVGILTSVTAFAADLPCTATYQVPSIDPASSPYTSFSVTELTHAFSDGKLSVKYRLPLELTGHAIDVTFAGPAGETAPDHLVGPNGEMTCANDVCHVAFHGLTLDPSEVSQFLLSKNLTKDELAMRVSVARQFASDPGGTLSYQSCGF